MNPREERRLARKRPPPSGSVRVTLGPADDPTLTSLWAAKAAGEGGTTVFTLLYDYPDLKPAAGWRVAGRAGRFVVTAVAGRQLTCAAEGGE